MCPTYWLRAVCYMHYGSCAVEAFQVCRRMMSFVQPLSRSWPTTRHCGPECVRLLTMLSWNHSSANLRDLDTAAGNSYHTEHLLTKLYSITSWPTTGMSYDHSYVIAQSFCTVCKKDHITRHCSTKPLISTMTTSSLECYIKTRMNWFVFILCLSAFQLLHCGSCTWQLQIKEYRMWYDNNSHLCQV